MEEWVLDGSWLCWLWGNEESHSSDMSNLSWTMVTCKWPQESSYKLDPMNGNFIEHEVCLFFFMILTWSIRYELDAFISHMGPSNHSGHYVCHIRDKQDPSKWVIFNDNKVGTKRCESLLTLSCCQVAESANPPKELGYLYLYKRVWNKRDWAFLFWAASAERIKLNLMILLSWRRRRGIAIHVKNQWL